MAQRKERVDPTWRILGWELLEANAVMLGDCHTDPSTADPITGLMPSLDVARAWAATMATQFMPTESRVLIPIALLQIPDDSC